MKYRLNNGNYWECKSHPEINDGIALQIEYQLSNGNWIVGNNPEKLLQDCEKYNTIDDGDGKVNGIIGDNSRNLTRREVIDALAEGAKLRTDPGGDWYCNCRSGEFYTALAKKREDRIKNAEMVKCACGCTVRRGSVMSTSTGTSCPDCYDNMSN